MSKNKNRIFSFALKLYSRNILCVYKPYRLYVSFPVFISVLKKRKEAAPLFHRGSLSIGTGNGAGATRKSPLFQIAPRQQSFRDTVSSQAGNGNVGRGAKVEEKKRV